MGERVFYCFLSSTLARQRCLLVFPVVKNEKKLHVNKLLKLNTIFLSFAIIVEICSYYL